MFALTQEDIDYFEKQKSIYEFFISQGWLKIEDNKPILNENPNTKVEYGSFEE